jgi:hypothetical protein
MEDHTHWSFGVAEAMGFLTSARRCPTTNSAITKIHKKKKKKKAKASSSATYSF